MTSRRLREVIVQRVDEVAAPVYTSRAERALTKRQEHAARRAAKAVARKAEQERQAAVRERRLVEARNRRDAMLECADELRHSDVRQLYELQDYIRELEHKARRS